MKYFPLKKNKILLNFQNTFEKNYENHTEIPLLNHPGSFGFKRKFHIHEGIDLYCENKDPVFSIEDGLIIGIFPFTGDIANSSWWNNTYSILIQHNSVVINYGELNPSHEVFIGKKVNAGNLIGYITPVLKKNKGRPMNMLHLEMYTKETTKPINSWNLDCPKPFNLLDPTSFLLSII